MVTTIQVEERTKNILDKMKMYPRETYNQIVIRLVKENIEESELSPETIKGIENALDDVKKGRVHSTKEVKKMLGIE